MSTNRLFKIVSAVCILAMFITSLCIPTSAFSSKREPGKMQIHDSTESGYDGYVDVYSGVYYYFDLDWFAEKMGDKLDTLIDWDLKAMYAALRNGKKDEYYTSKSCAVFDGYYYRELGYDYLQGRWNVGSFGALPLQPSIEMKTGAQDLTFRFYDLETSDLIESYIDFWLVGNGKDGNEYTWSWRIWIRPTKLKSTVGQIKIYDFDLPKHAVALDTEAWCDFGKITQIRYLDTTLKNEVTKAVVGEQGYVEFTIYQPQYSYDIDFDANSTVVLNGTDMVGKVSVDGIYSPGDLTNELSCKFYLKYTVAHNGKYHISAGQINITSPTDGATPNPRVRLSGVPLADARNAQYTYEGNVIWRSIDLKPVTTFQGGKQYYAILKLKPFGNYYFGSASQSFIKVPNSSAFNIQYRKAGDKDYIKSDGWYLTAIYMTPRKYYDISLSYDRSELSAPQNSSAYLTALSSYDLSKASNVEVKWYYSNDISKDTTGELCSSSDGDLRLQLDTSAIGTGYYKCMVSCTIDGLQSRVTYPASEWVKLTVTAKATPPLLLSVSGSQSVAITKKGQSASFEVAAKNANGTVNYSWYKCDASGKLLSNTAVGTGKKLTLNGISGDYGDEFYYKCTAKDSKNSDSVIFKVSIQYREEVTLPPVTDAPTIDPPTIDPTQTGIAPSESEPIEIPTETDPAETGEIIGETTADGSAANDPATNGFATDNSVSDNSVTDNKTGISTDTTQADGDEGRSSIGLIIGIVAAVLLLAAASAVVIIVIKKKKQAQ